MLGLQRQGLEKREIPCLPEWFFRCWSEKNGRNNVMLKIIVRGINYWSFLLFFLSFFVGRNICSSLSLPSINFTSLLPGLSVPIKSSNWVYSSSAYWVSNTNAAYNNRESISDPIPESGKCNDLKCFISASWFKSHKSRKYGETCEEECNGRGYLLLILISFVSPLLSFPRFPFTSDKEKGKTVNILPPPPPLFSLLFFFRLYVSPY